MKNARKASAVSKSLKKVFPNSRGGLTEGGGFFGKKSSKIMLIPK